MQFNFEEELRKLPHKPGIYIMHDANDSIIYVGKAIDLYNRVHSYFRESTKKSPKIQKMVTLIARFEYMITDSELEALVLENNLIKEHEPKYNTMLKDDKTYPYIKVTLNEAYPRILLSRSMKKDKAKYFGPFTNAGAVKNTIELLNRLYSLRTCNRVLPREIGKDRPCLNYHIHQCDAPCQGYICREHYMEKVNAALEFLGGNYAPVMKSLQEKMEEASENLEFEEAIKYRELLSSVRAIAQKQKITDYEGEDKDVIAMAREGEDVVVQVFFVRGGRLIGREHFHMKNTQDEINSRILDSFVKQFYAGTPYLPKEIMLQEPIEDEKLVEEWLSGKRGSRVYLKNPKIGMKEKLVDLAARNAELVLKQDLDRIRREESRTRGAVEEIGKLLGLSGLHRMEAFDISNISGFQTVGSMVVFEDGKPKRSDYRKFRIKTVTGPDDYACMHEVLTRRILHGMEDSGEEKGQFDSFRRLPDLFLMDGGRGQVNVALQVLQELNVSIPVCGMVKDDNHRTRGVYYNHEEIPIDRNSEGFKLITRVQDEAHRFAIEYHRSLRSKAQTHSILDDIPGVGPARKRALMKHFASIEDLRRATPEEIAGIPGIPAATAEEIYTFFRTK